jgi:hypothetical protein
MGKSVTWKHGSSVIEDRRPGSLASDLIRQERCVWGSGQASDMGGVCCMGRRLVRMPPATDAGALEERWAGAAMLGWRFAGPWWSWSSTATLEEVVVTWEVAVMAGAGTMCAVVPWGT